MIKPVPDPTWPESWKLSYQYDLVEIYGSDSNPGYTYAYHNRRQPILDLFNKYVNKGSVILDIAAGQGNFSIALDQMGYEVVWNDLREELKEYVSLKHPAHSIRFQPGNVMEMSFSNRFDAVLALEFIEHVAHPDRLLQKVSELLIHQGHLILSTPNGQYFRNQLPKFSDCQTPEQYESVQFKPNADGHIFLLHESELIQLAACSGLTHLETRFFTNPLTAGALGLNGWTSRLPKRWIICMEHLTQWLPGFIAKRVLMGTAYVFQKTGNG